MSEPRPRLQMSDAELTAALHSALSEQMGPQLKIESLTRRTWDYYSSFAIELLEVLLNDGQTLQVIAKDSGTRGRLPTSAGVKADFIQDPIREIELYRGILLQLRLGTPRYFGASIDSSGNHLLLFLEHVRGMPLWQIGDINTWCDVARWLAHFHQSCKSPAEARLISYDQTYYEAWCHRVASVVPESHAAVQQLLATYEGMIARFMSLPTRMIHGEFVPSHILIRSDATADRICPVDWEMAGVGPSLMDLADLSAGQWDDEQKQAITEAYRMAMPAEERMSKAEFDDALQLCRFHRAVQWLGWSANWTPPREHRQDWLAEALQLAAAIR